MQKFTAGFLKSKIQFQYITFCYVRGQILQSLHMLEMTPILEVFGIIESLLDTTGLSATK